MNSVLSTCEICKEQALEIKEHYGKRVCRICYPKLQEKEQRRFVAAVAAMQGLLANPTQTQKHSEEEIVQLSVFLSSRLINELEE